MSFESFAHVPITTELLRHVWEGEADTSKGGHRYGLGRITKTEFPEGWGISMVKRAIEETLESPQYIKHRAFFTVCERIFDGVVVRVVLLTTKEGLRIHSVYPTCGDGVFRNDAYGKTELSLDNHYWEQ